MEYFIWLSVMQAFLQSYFAYFPLEVSTIEESVAVTLNIWYISIIIVATIYIINLIFGGIGLSAMAKRNKIKGSWMAFVPFLNTYFVGKVAGEANIFGKKVKRMGLWAMLVEIVYWILSIVTILIALYKLNPAFYTEGTNAAGQIVYEFNSEAVPMAARWLLVVQDVLGIVNYFFDVGVIFVMVMLYIAFFRKYFARKPLPMTFLCALLPARGFVFFAVRNNTPVDYNAWMQEQMRKKYHEAQQTGPNAQGGYDRPSEQEDPFKDFKNTPNGNANGTTSPSDSDDSPFSDF